MTDVQDSTTGSEPSMEEILASIRRIIADENEEPEAEAAPDEEAAPVVEPAPVPEAAAPEEDALELTQAVQEDGTVDEVVPEPESEFEMAPIEETPVAVEPEPTPEPTPAPEPAPEPAFEPVAAEPALDPADSLVSDNAADAASQSLANLAGKVEDERKASMTTSFLGRGDRTLEDMVMELMKPMLKSWLDNNLPPIVERIVQKEVERIAGKADK